MFLDQAVLLNGVTVKKDTSERKQVASFVQMCSLNDLSTQTQLDITLQKEIILVCFMSKNLIILTGKTSFVDFL